jgi:hypothetical protein
LGPVPAFSGLVLVGDGLDYKTKVDELLEDSPGN